MSFRCCALVLIASLSCTLTSPGVGHAQGADGLWRPEFRRADAWDAVVIGVGGALYWGDELFIPRRTEALWRGPILWDSPLRNALRFEARGQRETAARASDFLFTGALVHNLLLDNLVIAWGLHGELGTAFQMTVADLEAYAIAGALTGLIKTAAGRERPYGDECRKDPHYNDSCGGTSTYRAFFSAHAATTAVGAGLLCAHHQHMPLYDNAALDAAACVLGVALTVTTGALRIASDRHWSTDVTTGHLVGFASGYLVPTLLHYQYGATRHDGRVAVLPFASAQSVGAQLIGRLP